MDFPVEKPTTVRTEGGRTSSRISALVVTLFFFLVVFKVFGFIDDLDPRLSFLIAPLIAFAFYMLLNRSIESREYDFITFSVDHLIVHYLKQPELRVEYDDIVKSGWGSDSFSRLLLKGNYPSHRLDIYKLENKFDRKFIDYLYENGNI